MKFSTSAKMSSYLVAMTVGDFKCVEGAADTIPIRICATPDKRELTHLALESAQQILHFYDSYYASSIRSASSTSSRSRTSRPGAMENTGAIFYREPTCWRRRSRRRWTPQENRVDPRARRWRISGSAIW